MKWLTNLKIEYERWQYRRKQRKAREHDADMKAKAILKASMMSEELGKRFWVVKHGESNYGVYLKSELKGALRSLGLSQLINMYQPNEYIIYITRKPE